MKFSIFSIFLFFFLIPSTAMFASHKNLRIEVRNYRSMLKQIEENEIYLKSIMIAEENALMEINNLIGEYAKSQKPIHSDQTDERK